MEPNSKCPHNQIRTDLEIRLLKALKDIEDARIAEEDYRWKYIGSYPLVKIPKDVRDKWLEDLAIITEQQREARKAAQALIKELS